MVPGCEGGQTGDLSGGHDLGGNETGDAGGCDEQKQKLGSFDDMTDAGTATQLLAYAEKSFDAPLTWKAASDGQSWTVGPESGQGTIHIDVARGDNAYALTYVAEASSLGLDIGTICPPPQLGVDAHVTVTTDGGALSESFDTLLGTSTLGVATLSVPLDLQKLNGSLTVSSSNPHAKLVRTTLDATLLAAGTTGSISGMEQVDSGSGVTAASSASNAVLAVWPDAPACLASSPAGDGLATPLDQEALGFTGTDTVAAVTPPKSVAITWMDGTKTTLAVDIATLGDGCFRVNDQEPVELGGGATVSYPITITLKSDDGRLDGSYGGQVTVTGSGDDRRVAATANLQLSVAELAKSGFASAKVPSGSDSLTVEVESRWHLGNASGSVRLFALATPPCASDPQPPMSTPGQGGSSSGCAGQSETQDETASWDD